MGEIVFFAPVTINPTWTEIPVTDIEWTEIPVDWLLDGSSGLGLFVGVPTGEGVVYSNLVMGADPGWVAPLVADIAWTPISTTDIPWTEITDG